MIPVGNKIKILYIESIHQNLHWETRTGGKRGLGLLDNRELKGFPAIDTSKGLIQSSQRDFVRPSCA